MGDAAAREASERYRLTLELFAAGEEIMRQNIRRRFPGATPEEIEEHLTTWLHERPGAEHGDAVGRPGTWPRQR
jgi:hypothetical protein